MPNPFVTSVIIYIVRKASQGAGVGLAITTKHQQPSGRAIAGRQAP